MLERIVYVSRAAPAAGLAEICSIVRAAHRNNAAAGVTGALVALDGWFAQALEGPRAGIDRVFARLADDPRHGGIEVRIRERGLCRLFAGQPLALRTGVALDAGLLADFGYQPGFPVVDFPAAHLIEFLVASCRQQALRGAGLDKRRRLS